MELKDYQIKVLEYLESYLTGLQTQKAEKKDYFEFQKSKGKEAVPPEKSDYCQLAWESLKAKMAVYRSNYTVRNDGMGATFLMFASKCQRVAEKLYSQPLQFNASIKIISNAITALYCGLCRAIPFIPKPASN
jgi:hypothetical protein